MRIKDDVKHQIRFMCELNSLVYKDDEVFIEFVYNKHLDGFSGKILEELHNEYLRTNRKSLDNAFHKEQVTKYIIELQKFKKAFLNLDNFINEANNLDFNVVTDISKYPFDKDFNELTLNVTDYINSSIEKLQREVDK
jgi:hypothetical protein